MALIRYPYKLIWHEHHPPELFDLSWDPNERSDQAEFQPDVVAALQRELAVVQARFDARRENAAPAPSAEAVEALRNMGYVE